MARPLESRESGWMELLRRFPDLFRIHDPYAHDHDRHTTALLVPLASGQRVSLLRHLSDVYLSKRRKTNHWRNCCVSVDYLGLRAAVESSRHSCGGIALDSRRRRFVPGCDAREPRSWLCPVLVQSLGSTWHPCR